MEERSASGARRRESGGHSGHFFTRACRRERERECEALGGRTEEEEASVTRKIIPRGIYIYMVSVNHYYSPFGKGECTGF